MDADFAGTRDRVGTTGDSAHAHRVILSGRLGIGPEVAERYVDCAPKRRSSGRAAVTGGELLADVAREFDRDVRSAHLRQIEIDMEASAAVAARPQRPGF